jgi:4-amino-4-deoxy-L-arabinose transferase-like glycosyltransferase
MNKIIMSKRTILRVLFGVFLFPLSLVVFSLNVPPGDLPLCGLMFALAAFGLVLARRESRAWRLIWLCALIISVLCGVLEVVAGQRIVRQRSQAQSRLANPARSTDVPVAPLFAFDRHGRGATDEHCWKS